MKNKSKIISLSLICLMVIGSVGFYSVGAYINGNAQLPKTVYAQISKKYGIDSIDEDELRSALKKTKWKLDKTVAIQQLNKALYDKKISKNQFDISYNLYLKSLEENANIDLSLKENLYKYGFRNKEDLENYKASLYKAGLYNVMKVYLS